MNLKLLFAHKNLISIKLASNFRELFNVIGITILVGCFLSLPDAKGSCKWELRSKHTYLNLNLYHQKYRRYLGRRDPKVAFTYGVENRFLFVLYRRAYQDGSRSTWIASVDEVRRLKFITGAIGVEAPQLEVGNILTIQKLQEIILGFNLNMVVKHSIRKNIAWPVVELEEIVQVAAMGMLMGMEDKNAHEYILDEGGAFSKIAYNYMNSSVNTYLRESIDLTDLMTHKEVVRLLSILRIIGQDVDLLDQSLKIQEPNKYYEAIAFAYNSNPKVKNEITKSEVKSILSRSQAIFSVLRWRQPGYMNDDDRRDSDMDWVPRLRPAIFDYPDENLSSFEKLADEVQISRNLKAELASQREKVVAGMAKYISKYTEKEIKTLILRFGLFGTKGRTWTFKEVGLSLHVSKERAEQLERQALIKLRTGGFYEHYKGYLEPNIKEF